MICEAQFIPSKFSQRDLWKARIFESSRPWFAKKLRNKIFMSSRQVVTIQFLTKPVRTLLREPGVHIINCPSNITTLVTCANTSYSFMKQVEIVENDLADLKFVADAAYEVEQSHVWDMRTATQQTDGLLWAKPVIIALALLTVVNMAIIVLLLFKLRGNLRCTHIKKNIIREKSSADEKVNIQESVLDSKQSLKIQ